MLTALVLIAIIGGILFLWVHYTKSGKAEADGALLALENRIYALENAPPMAQNPPPAPGTTTTVTSVTKTPKSAA
jgi:hypothetical protein